MTELYIIRHGDPDYATDSLTELGRREAELLSLRMKSVSPDLIFTSPLGRARETAAYTCRALGIEPQVENWMAEDMRYMRRLSFDDARASGTGYSFSAVKGIEEYCDFASGSEREDRAGFFDAMIRGSDRFIASLGFERQGGFYRVIRDDGIKAAAFCHGGFGAAWIAHLFMIPPQYGWRSLFLYTTSVSKFTFSDDGSGFAVPKCHFIGDLSHLSCI